MSPQLLDLAITQISQVTLLIVLAGLAHRLLADRAPRVMLMLWTLVIVKAVTPPVFASVSGVFSWAQAPLRPAEPMNLTAAWPPEPGWLITTFFALWAIGSVTALMRIAVRWRRLAAVLDRDAESPGSPIHASVIELAEQHDLTTPHRVVVSTDELGPAVTGLFRPTVVLPASLIKGHEPETLRPVLLHELVHLSRRDTLTATLVNVVRAVWWFNPLVWWAARQVESLVERCVDLTVVEQLKTSVGQYGRGLVRVLELRAEIRPANGLAGLRPCQITTERLNFLRQRRPTTGRGDAAWPLRIAFVLLATVLLPALPLSASAVTDDGSPAKHDCESAKYADGVPPLVSAR